MVNEVTSHEGDDAYVDDATNEFPVITEDDSTIDFPVVTAAADRKASKSHKSSASRKSSRSSTSGMSSRSSKASKASTSDEASTSSTSGAHIRTASGQHSKPKESVTDNAFFDALKTFGAGFMRFWTKFLGIWRKRPRYSIVLYILVFFLVTLTAMLLLEWSIISVKSYADNPTGADSLAGKLTSFVSQIWTDQNYIAVLNFLILAAVYLVVIAVLNRFWVATALFGVGMAVFSVANYIKIQERNEGIIPADLSFISGGNTGELMSFIPPSEEKLVNGAITWVVWFAVICIVLQILDRRGALIPVRWRPSKFFKVKNYVMVAARVLAVVLTCTLVVNFATNLNVANSWAKNVAESLSDQPRLWNNLVDARQNGTAVAFTRLAKTKTMDEPENYSKSTMEALSEKYAKEADTINAKRSTNLTDSTVVMILSETFSDPTRVPGVSFSIDPIPNVRELKEKTTSGLMLSPGYGGGTANIEYQSLTGMSLANFDASMSVPYQQLVPKQSWAYSFNQIWNEEYDSTEASVGYHPYSKTMYLRDVDYKKFGFSHFYTLDSIPAIEHQDHIDNMREVSDQASYQNILDAINNEGKNETQFLQLVTMQNHTPYEDTYAYNEFKDADTSEGLSDSEKASIEAYTKGISYTDQATADFLDQLDEIDKPVTVIFYGDHLPSVYTTANADDKNTTLLHETDYFIWSNKASKSSGKKLDSKNSSYTSSNYFMAQAAEHMDARVTPMLALLTEMHEEIPAMSSVVAAAGGFGDAEETYLDANGNAIDTDKLSDRAKELLADYVLMQYDMTAGKGYLKNTGFTSLDYVSYHDDDTNDTDNKNGDNDSNARNEFDGLVTQGLCGSTHCQSL